MLVITKKEVLDIARISRIYLYDGEIERIVAQLESVLTYAARVNEVACSTKQEEHSLVNIFREDQARLYDAQRLLKEGPEVEADYFVVPAILEHE